MSEVEERPAEPEQPPREHGLRQAIARRSRRPGWIWAVPLAALAAVVWLGVRGIIMSGPTVTVTFDSAGGVKPDQTKVKYNDMDVGAVESVKLHRDLRHVDVVLSLDADMAGHLGPGTRFWIAGGSFSLSNPSDIKALIAGPYIEVDPQLGKTVHHIVGLKHPPFLKAEPAGTSYTLHTGKLNSVSRGSPMYYLDLWVGEVQGFRMTDDDHGFDVYAFVEAPYDRLVHTGSRFWNASAVQFSAVGAGPSLRLQSIPALIEGAIAFETPAGAAAGPPAEKGRQFTLYDGKDAAENAAPADGVEYRVDFPGSAGGLDTNAPVELVDAQIGAVRSAVTEYDAASGTLATRATIVIDPSRITMTGLGPRAGNSPRERTDELLSGLIAKGLRAQLADTTPLIGGKMVALRFVPNAEPATLIPGPVPEIPSSSSAGIQEIIAKVDDVVSTMNRMPLRDIARNIHHTTERLARLSDSPELTSSLHHLDQSLANIDRITVQVRERIGPILAQIHQAASEAQATLASARSVFGAGTQAPSQPNTAGVPDTLYELARAARSLRELSDFLDRHPEALLKGRGKNG